MSNPSSSESTPPLKERLLLAGINEIQTNGIQGFSTRRVAAACHVSCAAPYKHFTDKQAFILAIIHYINQEWYVRRDAIAAKYPDNTRKQLVEISLDYIRFLRDNPHFRSVLMLRDDSLNLEQQRARAQVSQGSQALITRYCDEVNMPLSTKIRKTFVVRSLIYGAALMLDNGELENRQESFDFIAAAIDREFILP